MYSSINHLIRRIKNSKKNEGLKAADAGGTKRRRKKKG